MKRKIEEFEHFELEKENYQSSLNYSSISTQLMSSKPTKFPTPSKLFSPPDLNNPPNFIGNQFLKRKLHEGSYSIYTVNTLQELVRLVLAKDPEKNSCKLRFLLSPSRELLFAEEGHPSLKIPAHSRMTGVENQSSATCITAGNIKVSRDGKIQEINHKSGDFRPSFDSLQWSLAVAFSNSLSFADEILITELNAAGGEVREIVMNTNTLQQQISTVFSPLWENLKATNKDLSTRQYHYKRPSFDERYFAPMDDPELESAVAAAEPTFRKKLFF